MLHSQTGKSGISVINLPFFCFNSEKDAQRFRLDEVLKLIAVLRRRRQRHCRRAKGKHHQHGNVRILPELERVIKEAPFAITECIVVVVVEQEQLNAN